MVPSPCGSPQRVAPISCGDGRAGWNSDMTIEAPHRHLRCHHVRPAQALKMLGMDLSQPSLTILEINYSSNRNHSHIF